MRKVLLGIIVALLVASPVAAAPASNFVNSVVVNESSLHYGDHVTFTERYSQDAAKQARQPQYPDSPVTQINCYPLATGTLDYLGQTIVADKTKLTGGWLGITRPIRLYSGWPFSGRRWDSGAAHCYVYLFSVDAKNVMHIWATTQFDVAP